MSPPLLRKARAVLDAGDLGVPLLRRLLETETVRLRSTSIASEGPFLAFNHRNRRECGGLATRTGPLIQEEFPGEQPQPNHVVVRQPEGYRVHRVLTERPQFFGNRPSICFHESDARI